MPGVVREASRPGDHVVRGHPITWGLAWRSVGRSAMRWRNVPAFILSGLILNPLIERTVIPFLVKDGLDITLVHSVQWDILGALMENSYLGTAGHKAFFFLEMLMVYEAGHFPCG